MSVLDKFSLSGRKALVTGGNRGLGLAFSRGLAEAGAAVVIIRRDAERNAQAVAALRGEGHQAEAIDADIVTADASELVRRARDLIGGLDILVNNAGAAIPRPAIEVPEQEWDQIIGLNLTTHSGGCPRRPPVMREAGGGNIINIGSMSGFIVNRPQCHAAYNSSKAAVHHLTKSSAAEWADSNIRVNAVAPGYVKTEIADVDNPKFRCHWIEDVPMRRYAVPEEITPTVVYLASDTASFVTGSVVVVDGGYTVY